MSNKSSTLSSKEGSGNPALFRDALLVTVDGEDFHLGYSRIAKYLECPRQYKYSYIDRIPGKPSAAMSRGTAYHNTLESLLEWKIQRDEEAPLELALRAAAHFSNKESLSPSEGSRVQTAVDYYWHELYALHQPMKVEGSFTIHRGGVKLTGRYDLAETHGWIDDHKFSYDTWAETRAKYGCQPIIYQWAGIDVLEKEHPGWKYQGFAYNIIRTYPTPIIQELKIPKVSQGESDWWEDQIDLIARGIRHGVFPASPGDKVCQYCSFKALCKPTIYTVEETIIGRRNATEEDI